MKRIINTITAVIFFSIFISSCVEDKLYISSESETEQPITSKVFINEVFANGDGTTVSDWIELFNDSAQEIYIGGYAIYDEGIKTGKKTKRILPANTKIPAKGYLIINTDIDAIETVTFGLNTTSDAVYLENNEGKVVSQISWDATILGGSDLKGGKSYGRKPDGSTNWVIFTTPTKGTSNNNAN